MASRLLPRLESRNTIPHPAPPRLSPMDWPALFAEALPYGAFLDKYASEAHRPRWDAQHARVHLTPEQASLLGGFVRRMPVLVLNGAWCGDCINQCPIFDHFAAASPAIDL